MLCRPVGNRCSRIVLLTACQHHLTSDGMNVPDTTLVTELLRFPTTTLPCACKHIYRHTEISSARSYVISKLEAVTHLRLMSHALRSCRTFTKLQIQLYNCSCHATKMLPTWTIEKRLFAPNNRGLPRLGWIVKASVDSPSLA